MMAKMIFTSYWSAEEAEFIIEFLDELKACIVSAYSAEIYEMHETKCKQDYSEVEADDEVNF